MPSLGRLARFSAFALATSGVLAACYDLTAQVLVSSTPVAWTGTGSSSRNNQKRTLGLAGQDVHHFVGSRLVEVETAPYLAQFGGPYVLTSSVPTRVLGLHELEFAHGNRVGQTGELRLLYRSNPVNVATWVTPAAPFVPADEEYFQIVQICGLTAARTLLWATPESPDSHLFLSIRACGLTSGTCAGGVVEVDMNASVTSWWPAVGPTGVQVALKKPNGAFFSNECMPIAATGNAELARQYLVVGDPSVRELSVFDAFRLADGPVDHVATTDATRVLRDVVIEGKRESDTDQAVVGVLWGSSSDAVLRHHLLFDGTLTAAYSTDALPNNARFVESPGPLPAQLALGASLFTFGSEVWRRDYTPR